MALNVRSSIEVNTQTAEASLNRVVARFGNLAAVTEQTKNKIDILAHSFQAFSLAYQGLNKIKDVSSSFIQIADSVNLLNARLKLSTDGIKNFENASKALYSIAQNTANSVESVSNLFITLNRSFAELGYNQEKTLEVVSTFSAALKASGTASYNANIALKQLNDALAVGVLKGTDFKILIQNAPALLGYLSDALGITAGELKTMASEGALTTQVLINAFENMKDKVESDFKSLPLSVESASTQLKTATEDLIANINSQLGITDNLSASLASATKFIENHKESITALSSSVVSFAPHLIALIATFKTAPIAVGAFNSVLATTRTIFTSGVTATLTFASAVQTLKTAFMSFAPTLAIFGTLELLYYWLNKNEVLADKLNNTLSLTIAQISQMSKAQIQNSINELDDAYNKLSNQWAELNIKISKGQNLLGFKYDEKELTAFKAQMDEISKQKSQIIEKTKELKKALTEAIEPVKKTTSAVDETAKAFKSAMDSSAAFTKNITLLSDYQKEIKAINSEIDKLNELLKDNKLTESQRASALEQIQRLNGARAQTEAKIAKASEQNTKTSISSAKQIASSYTQALNAQISYFNAIKDHWGAANIELEKYQADLLDKVKKNLLSREQAEVMLQEKRVELEESANDKILKNIHKSYNEQIEFYKITGDRSKQLKATHEKARKIADEYIKKQQITAKKAIDSTHRYFLEQELKSFNSMNASFKENILAMASSWDEMVGGMAKSIEQGLFDFITGKTGSLSSSFKNIGNSMLQALISPMASSFSKGVAGIFSGILGGGGSSVESLATSLGLKLENGVYRGEVGGGNVEILTDGTILSGGANLADKLGLSSSATNILSAASTLKTAANIFTSGVSGLQSSILSTTFSPFGGVSSALNGFGLKGLGAFVTDFGTGFSNVFSFASNSGSIFSSSSIFAGGMGQALGSMAAGASIGGLVGSLGDKLFGAKTKAGLGGSLGGAIGTAILPGIGTAIGSLLGSAIGGLFGKKKLNDAGVQILGNINLSQGAFSDSNIKGYEDWQKKSWFNKKSWTQYDALSAQSINALNGAVNLANKTLKGIAERDYMVMGGKFSGGNGLNDALAKGIINAISSTALIYEREQEIKYWRLGYDKDALNEVGKILKQFSKIITSTIDNTGAYLASWQNAAKAANKETLALMLESINKIKTNIKSLKLDEKSFLAPYKTALAEAREYFNDIGGGINEMLGRINATSLDSLELAKMYEKGIKENFSAENVGAWNELIKAYNLAKEAQIAYTKALREFSKNTYDTAISIRGAYGLNTDILSLDGIKAGFYRLNGDIAATADSIAVFSQKLRDMSPAQIGEFLSYDTANRQELISYATQYASIGTTALENMKNAVSNYTKSIANLNEQIATLNEQYESSKNQLKSQIENINKQIAQIELNKRKDELNAQKEHYSALIALYKNQKRFAENLKEIANSLRLDVWGAKQISGYYNSTLAQAKLDYKSANYDSSALKTLSEVSRKQAENLKATAASAEQYRFEVLQMANEIEGIVPKSELESIDESLKNANKMLDGINAAIKELTQKSAQDKEAQIAALEANKLAITHETSLMQEGILKQIEALEKQKQEISKQTAELLRSNAELFGKLGGTFETGFLELVSVFELVATSVDDGFKGLGDELKAITSSASSGLNSTNLSWDALSLQIDGIYQKYFNRNAEWEGLKYWYEGFKNNQASADDILRAGIRNGEYLSSEALLRAQALGISTPTKNSFSPQSIDLNQQIEQGKKSLENQKVQIEHLEASKLSAQSQVEQLDLGLENLAMSLELEQGGLENIIEQTEQGKRQIKLAENSIDNLSYNFELLKNNEQALNSRTNATLYTGFSNMNEAVRSGYLQIAGSLSSAINQAYAQGRAAAEAAARASGTLAKANNWASNTGVKKFAQGGIVTAPTNALIGEAGYPEAVIPLKDGAGLKIDTSGIFEKLENRMMSMEQKLKMLLEKIEKNTNELNRTLSGVTDGDVLYINGKVKVG